MYESSPNPKMTKSQSAYKTETISPNLKPIYIYIECIVLTYVNTHHNPLHST